MRAPVFAVLLCATAFSIVTGTLPVLVRSKESAKVSRRTLTFAERVAYQHAIEDVYWRHRIWPRNRGERRDPKPSLDAMISQAQLEKKVDDYLGKSQTLEDYCKQPITAEQLQAEMDRMARNTKAPGILGLMTAGQLLQQRTRLHPGIRIRQFGQALK